MARIAYDQTVLFNQTLGGKLPSVWEAFPDVWSDEEVTEMRLEKYRQIMQRHAAQDRGQ